MVSHSGPVVPEALGRAGVSVVEEDFPLVSPGKLHESLANVQAQQC